MDKKDIEKLASYYNADKKDIEKLALDMLLEKEKFVKLYNSNKESDKTRIKLYTKQYALINYDFLVKLHLKKQEVKLWDKILKVTEKMKEDLKEREVKQ